MRIASRRRSSDSGPIFSRGWLPSFFLSSLLHRRLLPSSFSRTYLFYLLSLLHHRVDLIGLSASAPLVTLSPFLSLSLFCVSFSVLYRQPLLIASVAVA